MINDIAEQIGAVSRQVEQQQSEFGEIVTVTLERRYQAEVADVWQAITDPERLRRWFLPITGDLRPGGNFQLEGNAGGDILTSEAPPPSAGDLRQREQHRRCAALRRPR
jgi:hypothetical protein